MNINSINNLNINILFSESAEAIAFLHSLCEEKHFQFGIEEASSLKDRLSRKSLEFIDFFTDGDWAFGFLYDFLVHSKEYSDLSKFITFIDKYQDVEFIYRFLDRTLSREKISELICNAEL